MIKIIKRIYPEISSVVEATARFYFDELRSRVGVKIRGTGYWLELVKLAEHLKGYKAGQMKSF